MQRHSWSYLCLVSSREIHYCHEDCFQVLLTNSLYSSTHFQEKEAYGIVIIISFYTLSDLYKLSSKLVWMFSDHVSSWVATSQFSDIWLVSSKIKEERSTDWTSSWQDLCAPSQYYSSLHTEELSWLSIWFLDF